MLKCDQGGEYRTDAEGGRGRWIYWQTMMPHRDRKAMMLYKKKASGRAYAKAAPCIPKYFD